MRALVLAAILVTGLGGSAGAGDEDVAIRGVISDQFAAFQTEDLDRAFSFASPGIQQMFGSPGRFGQMVRQGYPMVLHPRSVRFADLTERNGRTLQRVLVTDDAGALHLLEYEMVPGDGGWRIDGVRLIEDGGVGA